MDSVIDDGPDLMNLDNMGIPDAGRNKKSAFQTKEEIRNDQLDMNSIDRQMDSVDDPDLDLPGFDNPNTNTKLVNENDGFGN